MKYTQKNNYIIDKYGMFYNLFLCNDELINLSFNGVFQLKTHKNITFNQEVY